MLGITIEELEILIEQLRKSEIEATIAKPKRKFEG